MLFTLHVCLRLYLAFVSEDICSVAIFYCFRRSKNYFLLSTRPAPQGHHYFPSLLYILDVVMFTAGENLQSEHLSMSCQWKLALR